MRSRSALSILLLASTVAGCYGAGYEYGPAAWTGVAIRTPPPVPRAEIPPPAPRADAVWASGFWDFDPYARRYVWVHGHWTRAPRPGVAYAAPHWVYGSRHGWTREPGRWVPESTARRY